MAHDSQTKVRSNLLLVPDFKVCGSNVQQYHLYTAESNNKFLLLTYDFIFDFNLIFPLGQLEALATTKS